MANRYFIASGATANWNDVNSWSETSGGAVGATVPTSSDNAIFDANSLSAPCNLTINAVANCLDLDFSGLDNLLTLTNSAYNLNVYGNLTLTSNTYLATSFTGTGYLQLRATTSVNITSNGCTRGWNRIYFNGVGGTWTNQDSFHSLSNLYLANGTWNTNNQIITIYHFKLDNGTKTLTLGSSTFNCSLFDTYFNTSGFTLNSGTSNIEISAYSGTSGDGGGGFFSLANLTFYNVSCNVYYSSACTFNNLTILPRIQTGTSFSLSANIIINGVFTISGYSISNRSMLKPFGESYGTPRTITVNGSIIASNVDFRDITLAGTANRDLSAIAGGSGDCGGNSGITFTPAANQYFKHSGSSAVNWSDTTKWFTTSGGSVQGRVPLPQDDAIFDANSFDANCKLNVNVPRIGGLNMEGVAQSVTFNLANEIEVYKSYILGNNITQSGNPITLIGRTDFYLNTYNKLINQHIYFSNQNCKCTLLSDLNTNTYGLYRTKNCIIDFNDFDVVTGFFVAAVGGVSSTVYMGNGIITLTSNPGWVSPNFQHPEMSTLIFNPTSGTSNIGLNGQSKSFNKVQFSGTHTGSFDVTGTNTIAELIIDAGRKVRLENGTTQTIAKLTSNGTPANKVTIQSTAAGSQATINYTGVGTPFIDNVILKDINFTVPVYAVNGTNLGNNTNVKYVWKVAKKTMGFPIRLIKDE